MKLVPVSVVTEYPEFPGLERTKVVVEYEVAPDDEPRFPGNCLRVGDDHYRLPDVRFTDLEKVVER